MYVERANRISALKGTATHTHTHTQTLQRTGSGTGSVPPVYPWLPRTGMRMRDKKDN